MKKNLTVENTGFLPDDNIEIKGIEYYLLNTALEQLIADKEMVAYPTQYKYVDVEGEPVENYTEEDLKEGRVFQVLDVFKTFNANNAVLAYCGNISHTMLEAMRTKYTIHERELEKGNAKSVEVLERELEKRNKLHDVSV